MPEVCSFSVALEAVKKGRKIQRSGWNGKGMWLRFYDPYSDKEFAVKELYPEGLDSGTLLPWIGIHTADNHFVPWLASQTDILAEDWILV